MPTINTNDLSPGMVLTSDAIHSNGRVLLRAGVSLEAKHIKMFKMWGVVGVEIQGVTREQLDAQALENLDPAVIQAVQDELSEKFRHTDPSHPMIRELHRQLVRLHGLRRAQGNAG